MRNCFPKRTSDVPLHTLSKLYDIPVGFVSPSFEAVYCYIRSRRRVAVARYRMICLILEDKIAVTQSYFVKKNSAISTIVID